MGLIWDRIIFRSEQFFCHLDIFAPAVSGGNPLHPCQIQILRDVRVIHQKTSATTLITPIGNIHNRRRVSKGESRHSFTHNNQSSLAPRQRCGRRLQLQRLKQKTISDHSGREEVEKVLFLWDTKTEGRWGCCKVCQSVLSAEEHLWPQLGISSFLPFLRFLRVSYHQLIKQWSQKDWIVPRRRWGGKRILAKR